MRPLSVTDLASYVAPQIILHGSFKQIMRNITQSVQPLLYRIEHKAASLFARGEWINNENVYNRLEARVARLSWELMFQEAEELMFEKKRVSLADTQRICQEVELVKMVSAKLKVAGADKEKLSKLDTYLRDLLDEISAVEPEISNRDNEKSEPITSPKTSPAATCHDSPAPSPIINSQATTSPIAAVPSSTPQRKTPSPTPLENGKEEDIYIKPANPLPPPRVSATPASPPVPVPESPLTPSQEKRKLVEAMAEALDSLIKIMTEQGLLKEEIQEAKPFDGIKDASEIDALNTMDAALQIIERGFVISGFAKWAKEDGGDIVFTRVHPVQPVYNNAVLAYSALKSVLYPES